VGYTIPEGVDTMLDVVGVGWPNVDEDAYRDMADALREFADDADDDAGVAYEHIQKLLASGQSESLTALDKHWSKVQGKHKDLAKAARLVAGALDRVADIIVARKIAAVGELADLCATVGITLAFAPVTAGLSTLLAGAKIAATRIAFKRILKEMAEAAVAEIVATLTEPAVAAIENIVADLAIQTALNVAGVQDGYNTDQTVQAGKDALQINSAGGPSGPGRGGGPEIDHDAHGNVGTHLASVQVTMRERAGSKLGKAKGHHGRAKGKDSLTAVLDTTIEGVTEKLTKALDDLGDHVGKKVPDAIRGGSKTHKDTDGDVRDRVKRILAKDGKDDGDLKGRRDGPQHGKPRLPESMRKAQDAPRENGVSLAARRCESDPVDIASGEMVLPQTDLELSAVLPFVLRRTHVSGYRYGRCFGPSWASTLDERLEMTGSGVAWAREDGSVLVYPALPQAEDEEVLPLEGDRLPLTFVRRDALGDAVYAVTDPLTRLSRRFSGSPYRSGGLYWLREMVDRNGNTLHIGRSGDGLPSTLLHECGYRVLVDSDAESGRVTGLSLSSPEGPVAVASFGYDGDGNLNAVTNSSGLPLKFTYDSSGRITSWTDRNNSTYTYVYDDAGRVSRTVGPDGFLSSSFAYDTAARITRFTDSTGATTVFHLNDLHQVVAETDPLGHTVTKTWDRYDRLLSRTEHDGTTTTWTWDARGNLVAVQEADGTVATAEYGHDGMPTSLTREDGAVWRYEYDDAGNNTALIAPDGAVTRYQHDAHGAIVAVTDGSGATETFRPNAAGLPMSRTDALGNTYTFTRDAFGRPRTITDPLGHVTTLEWNAAGQLLKRVDPDGTVQTWTYDGEGNCLTQTDGNGGRTTYEYTHFDLLASRTEPGGARYEFRYDTERRLTEVRNSAGLTWQYEYDHAGRVVRETDFDGRTLDYTHDATGRLLARTNPLGQRVTHHMDAMGRLIAKDVDGTITSFTYDRVGRLTTAQSPQSVMALEWDAAGRLVAETVDDRTTRYGYDILGRCTERITPSGVVTSQTYDAAGNRTRLEVDGNPLVFSHDARGREVSRTLALLDQQVTLTTAWDAQGRMSGHSLAAGGRTHCAPARTATAPTIICSSSRTG
jgi:YD repeat-containing protein